jgi:metallo-beta-lactamase class B
MAFTSVVSLAVVRLAALVAAAAALPVHADPHAEMNQPFPPHQIAENLYYVGSRQLASYLVTTKQGHILINPSFASTVPLIRKNIEQLGFRFGDVKILLASHAHDDHVEGCAAVKQQTGARVFVMTGDDKVIASGGQGQYLYDHRWKPCTVDRVLADGGEVKLGDATLVARRTPGHTRGCTTWTMRTRLPAGAPVDVVIVGSPNVNAGYRLVDNHEYPEIAADFAKSFAIWRGLPCDIFLGAHGNYYGLEAKHDRLGKGDKNPFVDSAGYRAYIDERERAFRAELDKQKRPPAAASAATPVTSPAAR